jgi:hypothetical protein
LVAKRDLGSGHIVDLKHPLSMPSAGGEQRSRGNQEQEQFSSGRFHRNECSS